MKVPDAFRMRSVALAEQAMQAPDQDDPVIVAAWVLSAEFATLADLTADQAAP